ncbi:MAG: serine/threonine-protein kinase [Polyangiaceae bacterium]
MGTSPPKLDRGAALRVVPVVSVNSVIDGKYRVEASLGQGGMGMVVVARHVQLGHRVAIKLLRAGLLDESSARRIVREAKALAALASEHVTRVIDVGELDSGEPFIVMELLDGTDLARLLKESGPLSFRDAATYVVQACDAIAEAHERGIVHRDLKLSNLFLTRRRDGSPLVKLLDFGISKPPPGTGDESLTTTQSGLGTPQYMAPEQFLDARDVDARTDIWALGVVLFHLLTGERLFGKEAAPALQIAMGEAAPPRLRDKLPEAPAELESLILDCLATSRADRVQSVAAFVQRLIPFADEDTQRRYAHLQKGVAGVHSVETNPAKAAVSTSLAETLTTWADTDRARPRRRRVLLVALLVGAMTAATAAIFVLRARHVSAELQPTVAQAALADGDPTPASSSDPSTAAVPAEATSALAASSSVAAVSAPLAMPAAPKVSRPGPTRAGTPTREAKPAPTTTDDPYAQRR